MTTEQFALTENDDQAIAVARALSADAVERAGSGHPGTAIALAGVAYLLYQYEMRHDPADPQWLGRDRFVLSAGHASLFMYTQMVLSGYGLEVSDLRALRTLGSLTPGHPERGVTPGVETTTGPLGAGLSNAVGMAMAARREHGVLDPDAAPGESVFDHYVYTLVGDGCLQEGVTAEAASLAGTQELGSLIAIYDDNDISIEGSTDTSFTEDVSARFEAYGWHVVDVDWRAGGTYHEDYQALHAALAAARAETTRPSLIRLHTIIAWPCPTLKGSEATHGAKLGAAEVAGLKEVLGLDPAESFFVPDGLLERTRAHAAARAAAARADWDARFATWQAAFPERAALLERLRAQALPEGWSDVLPAWDLDQSVATRTASGRVLDALAPVLPELWGGSADLGASNHTTMAGEPSFLPASLARGKGDGPYGRTLHFGVREHAMGSIVNGIALDGLTRPYCGTFMVFVDYMRPAVRLAALMGVGSVFVLTHDSIGVGEDGPTHQPVEHLASLRAIPGLAVVRPADANETVAAWRRILEHPREPVALVLSRQNLPVVSAAAQARHRQRGGRGPGGTQPPPGDRHPHPRGLRPLPGVVPRPGRRLPGPGPAFSDRDRLGGGRYCPGLAGGRAGLGGHCLPGPLRLLRRRCRPVQGVRLHRGERGPGGGPRPGPRGPGLRWRPAARRARGRPWFARAGSEADHERVPVHQRPLIRADRA